MYIETHIQTFATHTRACPHAYTHTHTHNCAHACSQTHTQRTNAHAYPQVHTQTHVAQTARCTNGSNDTHFFNSFRPNGKSICKKPCREVNVYL